MFRKLSKIYNRLKFNFDFKYGNKIFIPDDVKNISDALNLCSKKGNNFIILK